MTSAQELIARARKWAGAGGGTPSEILRATADALEQVTRERDQLAADVATAAGAFTVPVPQPGSDMAKVLTANRLFKQERDEMLARAIDAENDRDENHRRHQLAAIERDQLRAELATSRAATEATRIEADRALRRVGELERWAKAAGPVIEAVKRWRLLANCPDADLNAEVNASAELLIIGLPHDVELLEVLEVTMPKEPT